jgi:xylulokinase
MLAGIGVGLYRDEEDAFAQVRKPGVIYEPNPDAARVYERLFPIYQQLYPALSAVSHALSAAGAMSR